MSDTSVDYVRVFEGKDEQWYYESKNGNGQVLSTSEGYKAKHSAIGAAIREYGDQTELRVED